MIGSWVLNESFFSLSGNVNEFIQIISFCERSSFKLRCEMVIGTVPVYCVFVIKHVAFFTFGRNYSGIHMYQFTFEPLYLWFWIWL